jgi:PAS domain S-box-containing protein
MGVACAGLAIEVRLLLRPILHDEFPFDTLFGGIAIAVWYGGYGPALITAVLGYLGANYFFLEPQGTLGLHGSNQVVGLAGYIVTSSIIILFGEAMHRARRSEKAVAQEALQQHEQSRITLASIGDAVLVTDAKGQVTNLNPVAESLLGWKLGEVRGQLLDTVFHIINEETRKLAENPVARVIREGVIVGLANHTVLIAKDGTERLIDDSAAPIRDEKGNLTGVVLVFRDVTERRRQEREFARRLEQKVQERTAELHISEERFRMLVDGTKDYAIFMLDPQGYITTWNPGAERIKGYRADEIIGQHFSRFYLAEDLQAAKPAGELSIAAAKGRFEDEGWRLRKDGSRFWASVLITALYDEEQQLRGFGKITRDQTTRRQAEETARRLAVEQAARQETERGAEAVRAERERLRVMLECIGDAVIATDDAGKVTLINPVGQVLTGWSQAEAVGQPLETIFRIQNEQTGQPAENPVARVLREGIVVGLANHTVLISRGGTARPIDDSAAPIRGATGHVSGTILIFRDVTEQRRSERAVRESEARLAAELEAMTRLHTLSSRLLIHDDLRAALQDVIENAIATTGANFGNVQLYNPNIDALEIVVQRGFESDFLEYFRTVRVDEGSGCAQAMRAGEPVVIEDVELDPAYQPHRRVAAAAGYRAVQSTPLKNRNGNILGMLSTHYRKPRRPSERDRRYLDLHARQAADLIERMRSDEALRQSEAHKTAIFETAIDGIITMNHEGKIVEFNAAAEKIFGYGRAQVLGRELAETLIPASMRERHGKGMAHYLATGEGPVLNRRIEMPALRADGSEFPVELSIIRMPVQGPPVFTAHVRDISERTRSERRRSARLAVNQVLAQAVSLREASPKILHTIGDSLGWDIGALWIRDANAGVLHCDSIWRRPVVDCPRFEKASRDLTFAPGSGLPGRVWSSGKPVWIPDIAHEDNFPRAPAALQEGLHGAFACPITQGEVILGVLEFFSAEVREPDDDLLEMMTTLGNQIGQFIERKLAEEALRNEKQQMQIMADSMSAPVTRCSRDLRYLWVSKLYADWLGRSPNEIIGRPIVDVIGPEAFAGLRPHFERVLSGLPVRYEEEVNFRGLGRRWINAVYTPTFDAAGQTDGWVAVVIDIDDRRRMEEALKVADRRKDEFLAMLAHELRNPLAPIRNALQILCMAGVDKPTSSKARDILERQVQQLVRLVDDLLDVSRIMRGAIDLRKEAVELSAVVARAVETAQPVLDAKGQALTVTLPGEPVWLVADPVRLAQVLSNLLHNAAKYSDHPGRIMLSAHRDDDHVSVRIKDTGIGIAADMVPHIFDMFMQVEKSMTHSRGGLGIGLTLVRRLVEMHGGTVQAHSDGLGKGSEFAVRLPAMPGAPGQKAVSRIMGEGAPMTRRRILIVDDNVDAAQSMAFMISLWGHDVQVAHNGSGAIQAAMQHRPDVVLLDIAMPGMTGHEVARKLRQQPEFSQTLLVAMTGYGKEEDKRRSYEAGCDYHLVKPAEPEKLLDLLLNQKRSGS